MSLYEILPVFCPTQSVHGKICFGMHLGQWVSDFTFPEYIYKQLLQDLEQI